MAVRPVGAGGLRCLSLFTVVGVACGGDEDPSPGMIVRDMTARRGSLARLAAALGLLGGVMACAADAPAGGRVVEQRVGSRTLENVLGDAVERDVIVYLPAAYDAAPGRRFPVVYLLHAFGVSNREWWGGEGSYEGLDIAATLDSLEGGGEIEPMIVVMPDARTRLGGSWYAASPVAGDWVRFVADDLVAHVDSSFRTLPRREARGIAGQSMGAYGAFALAMRRPDIFGAVAAISPVLSRDPNPLGDLGMRMALEADVANLEAAPIPARVLWSRAAAFSPDLEAAPAFARLPYRIEGHRPVRVDEVWKLWEAATLGRLAAAHARDLAGLAIRIEVGDADPLADEARWLASRLDSLGAVHELEVFEGDHVAGVRDRFEGSVFQFFSSVLRAPGGSMP